MGSQNYYYQTPHPQTPHPWTPQKLRNKQQDEKELSGMLGEVSGDVGFDKFKDLLGVALRIIPWS